MHILMDIVLYELHWSCLRLCGFKFKYSFVDICQKYQYCLFAVL